VCVADELALEWEESFRTWTAAGGRTRVGESDLELLESLDRQLEAMSGSEHE
jgi:hypothetical protein